MEGDWSDARVTGNTDRTQQTIELINKIEMLEKQLEIAVKCLRRYARGKHWYGMINPKIYDYGDWAAETLKKLGKRS